MAKLDAVIRSLVSNALRQSTAPIAMIFCVLQLPCRCEVADAEENFIHSYALEIMEYSNMGTRFSSRASKGYVATFSTIEKCENLRTYMMDRAPGMFDNSQRFYQVLTCEPSTLPAAQ